MSGRRLGLWAVWLAGCLDAFPGPPADGDAGTPDADLVDARPLDATPDAERDTGRPDATADGAPTDAATDGARDAGDGAADQGCAPHAETCNGLDDDCDGRIDEVAGVGAACMEGLGACLRAGAQICDLALGVVVCDAQPGESTDEICNALDDDCDGATDEDLGVGSPCTAGLGTCQAVGVLQCAEGGAVACAAEPGLPGVEGCDGRDDDCDGAVDEGFPGVGDACTTGIGACERVGRRVCDAGGALGCDVVAGEPAEERCNALDDDCDGRSDEDLGLNVACMVGLGQCARPGRTACGEAGEVVCAGQPADPDVEACNGRDDDCDGTADEGFALGEACFVGTGACTRAGTLTCQGCSAQPGPQAAETCNDLDDDCDGRVDEANTCVATVVQGCRLWLGQADNNNVPPMPMASWDGCPISDQDREGEVRCTSTGRDGDFYALPLTGDVDFNDVLGVALICDPGEVTGWVQRRCEVFLGHSDGGGPGAVSALDPAGCAALIGPGEAPNPRCVRTGGDGLFHPMWLRGDVDENDVFGITWRCTDPDRPHRADGLQRGIAATFAWQFRDQGLVLECAAGAPPIMNDVADWIGCPSDGVDDSGTRRCATGSAEGAFRAFEIGDGRDVERCSALGVALRSR